MTDPFDDNYVDDDFVEEPLLGDDGLPIDDGLEPGEDHDEFAGEAAATEPLAGEAETPAEDTGPTFFAAGVDVHALDDLTLTGRPSVLERLGPAHFRSKGFSFMGFLQTVYDHVAEQAKGDVSR